MKKKIAIIIVTVMCAFMLTSCGAKVNVYSYTSSDGYHNDVEIVLPKNVVNAMQDGAAINPETNEKWTVNEYFTELLTSELTNFGYELDYAIWEERGGYNAIFTRVYADDEITDLVELTGVAYEMEYEHVDKMFTRDYTATMNNPYNNARTAYDAIAQDSSDTLAAVIKNGLFVSNAQLFPSLQQAFPALADYNMDALQLSYTMYDYARKSSSGEKRVSGDGAWYTFTRNFDEEQRTIDFAFATPVSWGWYLVALLATGATVLAIYLITREKKQKPTLLDRFPYNPETYRDLDDNLPAKRK